MQVASFTGSGTTVDVNRRYTSCRAVSRSSGLWSPPKVRQKAPSPTFTSTRLPARMSFSSCDESTVDAQQRNPHKRIDTEQHIHARVSKVRLDIRLARHRSICQCVDDVCIDNSAKAGNRWLCNADSGSSKYQA